MSMSDLLKLYNGTVSKGKTDGNEVFAGNPVEFSLNAAKNEEKCCKVALRCQAGYRTYGDTTVTAYHYNGETQSYEAVGGDVAKWAFAADEGFTSAEDALKKAKWSNVLKIAEVIGDTNQVFWVKAGSSAAEVPQNDSDESIHVEAVLEAV